MDKLQILLTKLEKLLAENEHMLNQERKNLTNNQHLLIKEDNNLRKININIHHLKNIITTFEEFPQKRKDIIQDILLDFKSPTYICLFLIIIFGFYILFGYLKFPVLISILLSVLSLFVSTTLIGYIKYLYYTSMDHKIMSNQNIEEVKRKYQDLSNEKLESKKQKIALKNNIDIAKANYLKLEEENKTLRNEIMKIKDLRENRIQELITQIEPDLNDTYISALEDMPQVRELIKER